MEFWRRIWLRLATPKSFKCEINRCSHRSSTEAGLRSHQAKCHSIWTCGFPECKLQVSSTAELDTHCTAVHNGKRYKKSKPKPVWSKPVAPTAPNSPNSPRYINTETQKPGKRPTEADLDSQRFKRVKTPPPSLLITTTKLSNARPNAELQEHLQEKYARTPAPQTPSRFGARAFAQMAFYHQSQEENLLPTPRRRMPTFSSSPEVSLAFSCWTCYRDKLITLFPRLTSELNKQTKSSPPSPPP